ncbi:MAG TPA: DUF6438 domain-containing protein [Hyphomonadaceae bacterium]|nr:DUF6438 domain-containing protein [Hyphomonadaceae bacterium]
MSRPARSPNGYLLAALAAAVVTACSPSEEGVIQAQIDDPVIALSEGPCPITCPVYDMTLHPNGGYVLNSVKFVRGEGVSEGNIGRAAWTEAEQALNDAGFWTLKPEQTIETMPHCQPDAPTAKITWRTSDGKEKTVTYDAGCGVQKMQQLVGALRNAMKFDRLVWSNDRFDPSGNR